MIRLKHRMLYNKGINVVCDGNIKYSIDLKNRESVFADKNREDFEIDGLYYIKDVRDELSWFKWMNPEINKMRLFEISINGEFWTDATGGLYTFGHRDISFSDTNIFLERDWLGHNYKVFYNSKLMFTCKKKFFSTFFEIEIHAKEYRYQALAIAIIIDRISHYDLYDNIFR